MDWLVRENSFAVFLSSTKQIENEEKQNIQLIADLVATKIIININNSGDNSAPPSTMSNLITQDRFARLTGRHLFVLQNNRTNFKNIYDAFKHPELKNIPNAVKVSLSYSDVLTGFKFLESFFQAESVFKSTIDKLHILRVPRYGVRYLHKKTKKYTPWITMPGDKFSDLEVTDSWNKWIYTFNFTTFLGYYFAHNVQTLNITRLENKDILFI